MANEHWHSSPQQRSRERDLLRQLREALARLRMAVEIAGLGFWEWNLQDDTVYFSPEWKKQLGYEEADLPNLIDEWKGRLHPDDKDRVLLQMANFAKSPTPDFEIEYRLRHRDGQYRWMTARCTALGEEHRRLAVTHIDITAKRKAEEQLRYVAGHDGLTGMPNRRLLYEFAEHMVASARRSSMQLAVLFIDLDDFKPVNDTYGHHVGDRVLRETAQRIAQSVRAEDMVGRIGGDEFVAILAKVESDADVTTAALHMLENLRRAYRIDALELQVPASLGIAVFPRDGEGIETLIEHADAAMYHAKTKREEKMQFFMPQFHNELHERAIIAKRIKEDLASDRFRLAYQPVFDCDSGEIIGVEAQLRWPGNDLSPSEFIPVAETNGQILALGEWVLREAGRQLRAWHERNLPLLPMTVKVSPVQFFRKDFCRDTTQSLANEGIAPTALRLEVSEGTLMRSDEEVDRVMKELKQAGLGVEIKEFGHGYSSLEQLSRLPIAAIKINTAHCGEVLTETVLLLGQKLGFDVVACHVESANALNTLKRQHYHKVQGFHLCRPLSGAEFGTWYSQHANG
ncbi:MAG TPA: EAL domain-containing protein [Rhodocyclaceae bacterium]|nr:EAL domain-containing protein [Rhodocyclaceae bacterium]